MILKLIFKFAMNSPLYPYWLFFREEEKNNKLSFLKWASGIILDIGCGSANYREYCLELENVDSYYCIDYPVWGKNLTDAENEAAIKGKNIELLYRSRPSAAQIFCDGTNLCFKSNSVDTVLSLGVLEHVLNSNKYIEEAYRVLRPQGVLIMTIPFLYQAHGGTDAQEDYHRWTKAGLKLLLNSNGFNVVEIENFGGGFGSTLTQLVNSFIIRKFRVNKLSVFWFILCSIPFSIFFLLFNCIGFILDLFDHEHVYASGFRAVGIKSIVTK